MAAKDYTELTSKIIELTGGKENISHVLHCATRLRFNLVDDSKADDEALKKLNGVLGTMRAGGQLQVIIGPEVADVYDALCRNAGIQPDAALDINEGDKPKEKLTLKKAGQNILDALSGSLAPVIPVIVTCAFFKAFLALLGPDMLNLISPESNLYTLMTFVGDAGFYFFPVVVGYSAAKKFGVLPVLGILLGCIMMHPTFVALAGTPFSVFGIPCNVQNYASTILPVILSVWVMKYVEAFFNKHVPVALRSVFAPALTITVMLPISLCVLGPAGAFLGNYVVAGLLGLHNIVGFLGVAIISALYPLLVITGMHMVLIMSLFQVFATVGFDGFAAPALTISAFAVMGTAIGAALRLKKADEKALAAQFALTAVVAGTSEPTLYGICTRYKKPFIGLIGGGFLGGLYCGITNTISATLVPATNFTSALCFMGANTANLVNGLIGCAIALIGSAALTYFFGFYKDEPGLQK